MARIVTLRLPGTEDAPISAGSPRPRNSFCLKKLERASAELVGAQREAADLAVQFEAARGQAGAANAAAGQTRDELDAERRAHAGAIARLRELQRQLAEHQAQQEEGRRARPSTPTLPRPARPSNARADVSDRRALLEIEPERQARAHSDKQAETPRAQLSQADARQREEAHAQADAGARLQARLEAIEGSNRELLGASSRAGAELALREQLSVSQAVVFNTRSEPPG